MRSSLAGSILARWQPRSVVAHPSIGESSSPGCRDASSRSAPATASTFATTRPRCSSSWPRSRRATSARRRSARRSRLPHPCESSTLSPRPFPWRAPRSTRRSPRWFSARSGIQLVRWRSCSAWSAPAANSDSTSTSADRAAASRGYSRSSMRRSGRWWRAAAIRAVTPARRSSKPGSLSRAAGRHVPPLRTVGPGRAARHRPGPPAVTPAAPFPSHDSYAVVKVKTIP